MSEKLSHIDIGKDSPIEGVEHAKVEYKEPKEIGERFRKPTGDKDVTGGKTILNPTTHLDLKGIAPTPRTKTPGTGVHE